MRVERTLAATTVVAIVAVAVASGPLVGAVDLTHESRADATANVPLGNGTATISVVSTPDTARLDPGEYGAKAYSLRVPNATVAVASVHGRPFLNYELRIEGLNYSVSSLYVLGNRTNDRIELGITSRPFSPTRIDHPEYAGELVVALTDDRGRRVVDRGNVSVGVAG